MRAFIAKIVYVLFFLKIKHLSNKTDCVLSIYGHNQKKESFEKIIKWLIDRKYIFISVEVLYLIVTGKKKIDRKYVWVSFDDGWKSNYDDIFPILKKYNIPATIFIATKGVNDGYYWFTKAFQNRNSHLFNEVGDLWLMPNQRRIDVISQLPDYLGERVTMNKHELYEMAKSGLIHFDNHTHDHVISNQCSKKELFSEISMCNRCLYDYTKQESGFIYSYPNGNFDEDSIDVIKNAGFKMAVTTRIGNIYPMDNVFALNRNEFKNACLQENILQIYGLWTPFFNVIKKIFFIRDKK